MPYSTGRGIVATVIACLAASTLTSAAAAAQPPVKAVATGSIGAVDVVVDGEEVVLEPIAPCDADGEQNNKSGRVKVDDVATFGGGTTKCGRNANSRAEAAVAGRSFSTDVLREWGGPRIRAGRISVRCETTGNGSSGGMEISGLRGIDVPEDIPPNYTVTVPGRIEGAAPLAKVVLNELIAPSPPDGSMTLHAMRIELFPEGGGPNSGDLIIGTANCDPYGG